MHINAQFWQSIDTLLSGSRIEVDRPKTTPHPRFPEIIYPLDYGFVADTMSSDGAEVDVWVGSKPELGCTGVMCTIDSKKRDVEMKLLWGCDSAEIKTIHNFHNQGFQSAIFVPKPTSS